jgi:hypothetical protein
MKMPATQTATDWSATLDCGELKVTGQITFPTTGYTVQLKKAEPQGINPAILLLDKVVTAPTGIVADHVVNAPVSYEEKTSVRYEEVQILPDGISIKVKDS